MSDSTTHPRTEACYDRANATVEKHRREDLRNQAEKDELDAECRRLESEIALMRPKLFADDSDSPVASCNCNTKTPDIQHHKRGCKYRLISERDLLRKFVESIAKQKLSGELEEPGGGDFEEGYDTIVQLARGILNPAKEES